MNIDEYIKQNLTHSIHTSERLSFRGCRRRWDWIHNERWYPTVTPKPLEFGTAYHKGMETWYDPELWDKDPETREQLAIVAFVQVCKEQYAAYLKANAGSIDPEAEEDYKERIELGKGMIRYHCRNVSPTLDKGFRPYATEIEFEVPITDEEGKQLWCKCDNCWERYYVWTQTLPDVEEGKKHPWKVVDQESARGIWMGLPITYGGRIDMLAIDENGRYWVFDWKTAARLSGQEEGDSSDEYIVLDDQITSYLWALWTLGLDVAGFVHHETKKAFPIEPEPNKTQRKGCWFSVNKQQNTSYELYVKTVSENDPTGYADGSYDDFLEWLKNSGPRFYSRKQVARSREELANAGRNIMLEALEMTNPKIRIYPSPGRFACSFCAFRQPCIGMNRDEEIEYMLRTNFERRTHRYWEQPSSTDSKGGR